MKILLFLLIGLAIFFGAASFFNWKAVENWRLRIWREASTWLQGGSMAVMSMVPFDPVTGLGMWNMMPESIRDLIPHEILLPVAMTLSLLAVLAKYIVQPKSKLKIAEKVKPSGKPKPTTRRKR